MNQPAIIAGLSARDLEASGSLNSSPGLTGSYAPMQRGSAAAGGEFNEADKLDATTPFGRRIQIRALPTRWYAVRALCECGCGHVVRSALGATVVAAVQRFRFARREAALVQEAFDVEP